ncbi:PREDICTED: retinoid-inducible serine carboxypeptidase-like [Wasmannia auropunctata]|uniref:retinoid-inducible serine carboxypeptidase-like n=1 Tax=Wasmannia auropunctata TaxID=64793 RepID=UPI0005EE145B|nr:PREDICTED: retinoid-inducible serine carboxypeptidase-like [Wasmannia auropunctata]
MRDLLAYTFAVLCFVSGSIGRKGFGPGEQEWDYVQVRPKAYMFWWLYYTTADTNAIYDKPLIIWLQGGPGGSSTSFGNFEELGPLDVNLQYRNYTWVKDYNVLFIDNPVGTGYSYVTTTTAFATTNTQIATDLVECMRGFYKKLPVFEDVPTYITTESYGGKMGAEFALIWDLAQKAGTIKSNLKGVALGDAWISPVDSVLTWAPFLLSTGMIDTEGFQRIDKAAQITKNAVYYEEWTRATQEWARTQGVVLEETYNVDFYNILSKMNPNSYDSLTWNAMVSLTGITHCRYPYFDSHQSENSFSLDALMNGPVKKALGIQVVHGSQSNAVFKYLNEDFMKPVIHIVERLLNETDLNVFVYNGHMDLIVDTPGTLLWVEKLKWKNADTWKNSARRPLLVDDIVEGYIKAKDNFRMYWVNRAGHMVPKDNPTAQKIILQDLTSNA